MEEKNNKIHDFRIICGSNKIKIPPTPEEVVSKKVLSFINSLKYASARFSAVSDITVFLR